MKNTANHRIYETPEALRDLLRYEPDTGRLFWRARPYGVFPSERAARAWNARFAGAEAGSIGPIGYRRIRVFGRLALAHRVAWAIHSGVWPEGEIDHMNHARADNRIANLRVVTNSENSRNQSKYRNNASGITGIFWNRHYQKWHAHITAGGKRRYLGLFNDLDAAVAARKAAEREHGFHENHGVPAWSAPLTGGEVVRREDDEAMGEWL